MYNDIVHIYSEIFPVSQAFLALIPDYLGAPGSRVLDLGCGPGHYVHALSQAHYEATGIDSSVEMIRWARAHHQGTFFNYGFAEIDKLTGLFDCAYCVGNSLSYLPDAALPGFFEDLRTLLSDGGHFVVQLLNWDRYLRTGSLDFAVKTLSGGRTFHRRYAPAEGDAVTFHTELRNPDGTPLAAWADTLYPKTEQTMRLTAVEAGLTVDAVFGDYHKSAFEPETSPLLVGVFLT